MCLIICLFLVLILFPAHRKIIPLLCRFERSPAHLGHGQFRAHPQAGAFGSRLDSRCRLVARLAAHCGGRRGQGETRNRPLGRFRNVGGRAAWSHRPHSVYVLGVILGVSFFFHLWLNFSLFVGLCLFVLCVYSCARCAVLNPCLLFLRGTLGLVPALYPQLSLSLSLFLFLSTAFIHAAIVAGTSLLGVNSLFVNFV